MCWPGESPVMSGVFSAGVQMRSSGACPASRHPAQRHASGGPPGGPHGDPFPPQRSQVSALTARAAAIMPAVTGGGPGHSRIRAPLDTRARSARRLEDVPVAVLGRVGRQAGDRGPSGAVA